MFNFPDFNWLDELQRDAIAVIDAAQLSQLEHLELSFFVNNTVSGSKFAALLSEWEISDFGISEFILRQVSQAAEIGLSVEDTLRSLSNDLKELAQKFSREHEVPAEVETALRKRQGGRCFISGRGDDLQATYVISPSVLDDGDLKPGDDYDLSLRL